ncbi:serine hydrolase [Agromyces sp. CFH 90414]|uniref:Serine hydrolase n=1 Tax=Agromyces agglutinans TaxID=2662258 RepID=A0A6I2FAD1_9MICO|nr:serine hydrolase [Agromyces agglutinans]
MLVVALALGVAACVAPSESSPDTAAPSAPATPTAIASTCVESPETVAALEPTAESTSAELDAGLVASLDATVLATLPETTAPGAVVGVRTPEGTWRAAYGSADAATGEPMAVGMHTRVGSVTKPFTVSLIMQLAEDGLLGLDDHLAEYVDGVPNGDRITLRQLADMTSGVGSYTFNPAFTDVFFAAPQTVFAPDELIAAGIEVSPRFDPGTSYEYSNTNTVLLGVIAEHVTGSDIGELFAARIFEPLGLDQTVWPGSSTDLPEPYAHGITWQGDGASADAPLDATHWNPSWGFTAGEIVSSVDDLLVFGRALGTGQGLLADESQVERLTSFPGSAGYGLGFGCVDGWVGHTGELPGYNTAVFHDTTTDTTVVVQTNSDIASGDCDESPVRASDPRTLPCSSPATRIFAALSTTLGHTFTPNPQH